MDDYFSGKKKLLSICDISSNKNGSFEEFLIELTKHVTTCGYEHTIIFREYPIESVEKLLIQSGAKIEVIRLSRFGLYNLYKIGLYIKKFNFSIIHLHFLPSYSAINLLPYLFDVKLIYTDHMGGRIFKNPFKKALRKYYYYLSYVLFNHGISKIICVSNFVKQKYEHDYGISSSKLCVIHNGIKVDKFKTKLNIKGLKSRFNLGNDYVVSCVGLRKDKGAQCLLKAAPLVIDKLVSVKFLFVGSGECKNYIIQQIKDNNLQKYCVLTGNITDISDIYTISDCVVIPSLFEEAFCFVAAEAIANDSHVVAFDSGAIKEVLNNSEYIISRDYKLLSEKIVDSYHSNSLPCQFLKEYVLNNFTLERNIAEHLKLYESL